MSEHFIGEDLPTVSLTTEIGPTLEMSYNDPKQEVLQRLFNILLTLLDILNSKTFWVALSTAVGTYQMTGDPLVFLYAAGGYIAKNIAADVGKERAKINNGR